MHRIPRRALSSVRAPIAGTTDEVLAQIAAGAGLKNVFEPGAISPAFYLSHNRWTYRRWRIGNRGGRATLLEALEEILQGSRYDAILSDGLLRIVPQIDAAEFWREWWRDERRR